MYAKLYDTKGRLRLQDILVTDYAEDSQGMLVVGFRGPEQAIRALGANIARSDGPDAVLAALWLVMYPLSLGSVLPAGQAEALC
jgi:hypothetical protein